MSFDWIHAAGLKVDGWSSEIPCKEALIRLGASYVIGKTSMHANPRLFKYYWRVWTLKDMGTRADYRVLDKPIPWQDRVPVRTTAAAMDYMRQLDETDTHYLVDNERHYRIGASSPFDFERLRQRGADLAPALEDDPSPEFFGHR